jgi:hypothetical protein
MSGGGYIESHPSPHVGQVEAIAQGINHNRRDVIASRVGGIHRPIAVIIYSVRTHIVGDVIVAILKAGAVATASTIPSFLFKLTGARIIP